MILSLNENEDAEKYLSEHYIDKNIFNKLRVIAGYFFEHGYNKEQVKERLREHIARCGESPSLNVWNDTINMAIKRASKTKLIQIDYLPIYKSELDKIETLSGIRCKRLAFTLLCLSKYRDALNENNDHWVCYEHSDIMKMANIKDSLKEQARMYRQMTTRGYLFFPDKVDSISMKVLYSDESGEEAIRITNMKNLGYQYLKYIGEPYFECACCGNTVKIDNEFGRPQKYCKECATIIHAQQKTNSIMRIRDGVKECVC